MSPEKDLDVKIIRKLRSGLLLVKVGDDVMTYMPVVHPKKPKQPKKNYQQKAKPMALKTSPRVVLENMTQEKIKEINAKLKLKHVSPAQPKKLAASAASSSAAIEATSSAAIEATVEKLVIENLERFFSKFRANTDHQTRNYKKQ